MRKDQKVLTSWRARIGAKIWYLQGSDARAREGLARAGRMESLWNGSDELHPPRDCAAAESVEQPPAFV